MIVTGQVGQEQFICQEYTQHPTGSSRISLGYHEMIPGGRSSGMRPGQFDQTQLAIGTKVEFEHTRDIAVAREIAMDHLAEDPLYYEKLASIHLDGAGLGDSRSEFIDSISIFLGKERAEEIVAGLEDIVQTSAEEKVKPLVTTAIILSGIGLLMGGSALLLAMRR